MSTKAGKALLSKYKNGTASESERRLVEYWYAKRLFNNIAESEPEDYERIKQEIWERLDAETEPAPKQIRLWPAIRRIAVAAASVAVISLSVWLYTSRHPGAGQDSGNTKHAVNDIAPGRNGATLSLSNGQVIQLSGAKQGVIIANGKVLYSVSPSGADPSLRGGRTTQSADEIASLPDIDGKANGEKLNLTASTAKGQAYEFTLPDGSHIILNADSKITFPSRFSGKERRVVLVGEAYFNVAHDASQPFRVESRGQIVEDIGTAFNINAYGDEPMVKTTLIEGLASVNGTLLKPNQQASQRNGQLKIKEVNAEEATAWRSGVFIYNGTPLEEVMRQISRWYNVDVNYADPEARYRKLGGTALRTANLSVILRTLESTGTVKFKVEGRKITVE